MSTNTIQCEIIRRGGSVEQPYPHICIPVQESELLDADTLAFAREYGFAELAKANCKCRACGVKILKGEERIAFRVCLQDTFQFEEIAAKFKTDTDPYSNARHAHTRQSATTNYFIHARECR